MNLVQTFSVALPEFILVAVALSLVLVAAFANSSAQRQHAETSSQPVTWWLWAGFFISIHAPGWSGGFV